MDGVPLALAGLGESQAPGTSADTTLLARAVGGEEPAREALASRYRTLAYLLALQLTGHREDARDLAQEAMVRFFAHLPGLRAGQDPRPWTGRIRAVSGSTSYVVSGLAGLFLRSA